MKPTEDSASMCNSSSLVRDEFGVAYAWSIRMASMSRADTKAPKCDRYCTFDRGDLDNNSEHGVELKEQPQIENSGHCMEENLAVMLEMIRHRFCCLFVG